MSTPGSFGAVKEKKKNVEKPPKVRKKLPGPFHESLKPAEGEGEQLDGNVPESLEKSWAQWKTVQKIGKAQSASNTVGTGSDHEDSEAEGYAESDPFGFESTAANSNEVAESSIRASRPKAAGASPGGMAVPEPTLQAPPKSASKKRRGLSTHSFAQTWSAATGSLASTVSSNSQGMDVDSTYHAASATNGHSHSSFSEAEPAAPSVWESAEDPGSGCIYYFNRSTGERTWECPPELLALSQALEEVQKAAELEIGSKLGPEAIAAALMAEPGTAQPAPVVLPPVQSLSFPQLGPKVVPPPSGAPGFTAPLQSKASAPVSRPGLGPAAARLAALADAVAQGRR
jgi:hypothetical protein